MAKNTFHIVIVEDDPFARNWMALLAARDWRTRLAGEVSRPLDVLPILQNKTMRVDLLLMDTDIPGGEDWITPILGAISGLKRPPAILCTGIRPNPYVLGRLAHPAFVGYILKDEIGFSLAWAVSLAMSGKWVITESIRAMSLSLGIPLPRPCVMLDGRRTAQQWLTHRQADVARLAFLFSMERRELADELGIVEDWGYGLVSQIYEHLGVKEILRDDATLKDYFAGQELLTAQILKIRSETNGSLKAHALETLAFHLITMPEIVELG